MSHRYRRIALTMFTLTLSAAAVAQQAPDAARQTVQTDAGARPAAPTAEQRKALAEQEARVIQGAQQVTAMVDGGKAGEIWDGASPAMKRSVSRDEFIKQINADRARLGAAAGRSAGVVSHYTFPAGSQVPQGQYISVASMTRFANQQQPIRELVSFRLDEDKVWRVSGYSVRQQDPGAAPVR